MLQNAHPRQDGGRTWGLALRIVATAVAVGIALWLLVTLRAIALQVVVAIILATGLRPLVNALYERGLPRAAAVLLIYLALIVAIVAFFFAVIPPIAHEVEEIIQNAPALGAQAGDWLRQLSFRFPFLPPLDEQVVDAFRGLSGQIGAIASQALVVGRFALGVFSGLLNVLLVLLITLYLIVDGRRVRDYFVSFLEPERQPQVREVTDRMGIRMGGWLLGQVTLSVTVGLVSWLGLTVIGVPGAVLLAVIAGIGEAIPIVGPIGAAVPAIIVASINNPLHGLLTLGLYIGIQQLENNLLVPRIMGRALDLHPLAVVLALLAGGELLGIIGAIVAVPVAAASAVVLDELRHLPAPPAPDPGAVEEAQAISPAPPT